MSIKPFTLNGSGLYVTEYAGVNERDIACINSEKRKAPHRRASGGKLIYPVNVYTASWQRVRSV
jgi:hypothetical protein